MTQETRKSDLAHGTASPWSVKGIDAETRLLAKQAARRAGMTMGAWLTQAIRAGGEPDQPTSGSTVTDRMEAVETRLAQLEGRFDDTVTPLSRAVVKMAERIQQLPESAPPQGLVDEQEMSPEERRDDPRFNWLYRTLSQEKQE